MGKQRKRKGMLLALACSLMFGSANWNNLLASNAQMTFDEKDSGMLNLSSQPRKTITGVVKDENGDPVTGASVSVKGTTVGVIADIDGKFSLSHSFKQNDVLVISFIGMKTVEEKIGNRKEFTITLHADATDLNEVVVIGYGTSTIKDLTGSVASVTAKQLDQLNTTNVSSMLQNLASGVQVSQSTGQPGETIRVRVRGATSLTGSNEPLYVIDGVPIDDPTMLDAISPNDIQSMDVLKDASASAIYGSRAANGVVIITTKRGTEGKPSVSFNYNLTTDFQIKNFRILYGDEWETPYANSLNKHWCSILQMNMPQIFLTLILEHWALPTQTGLMK